MPSPGSNTPHNFWIKLPILVMLSGIVLVIYIYLRRMITINKAKEIYGKVLGLGIKDPLAKYIVCQAAHETAGFTSTAYKVYNNLFGMNYAGQALATGKGDNNLAIYEIEDNSLRDLKRWLDLNLPFYLPVMNYLSVYVSLLKGKNYFTDSEENYLSGCQKYYNMIFA